MDLKVNERFSDECVEDLEEGSLLNELPQRLHKKGFSLECVLRWSLSVDDCWKAEIRTVITENFCILNFHLYCTHDKHEAEDYYVG
jgi:hypothetical protein